MSKISNFWVYILASRIGGTLYIGVTNDLVRRVYEHREKFADGFTKKNMTFIAWFISSNLTT
jgi:predicted GIY-YIG superfamily endonuclease